jgi:hypothetical protein
MLGSGQARRGAGVFARRRGRPTGHHNYTDTEFIDKSGKNRCNLLMTGKPRPAGSGMGDELQIRVINGIPVFSKNVIE